MCVCVSNNVAPLIIRAAEGVFVISYYGYCPYVYNVSLAPPTQCSVVQRTNLNIRK